MKFFAFPMPPAVAPDPLRSYLDSVQGRVDRPVTHEDRAVHRQRLQQWNQEIGACLPFPNRLVTNNPTYNVQFEMIDIEPRHFELARLTELISWLARLELTKGGGSATKKPEMFAARGLNLAKIALGRDALKRNVDVGFSTAVLRTGNCGETSNFIEFLALSLDSEHLRSLGIHLQAERVQVSMMEDPEHDHEWVVAAIDDDMPLPFDEMNSRESEDDYHVTTFPEDAAPMLWAVDAHQLYPMACRHDHSTYNHLDHTEAELPVVLGSDPDNGLNMAVIDEVRADINARIGLGTHGLERALQEPFMLQARIRSKFVDRVMREQSVGHYAQVDVDRLSPADREKFQSKVIRIEEEIERKMVKLLYKEGLFEERWFGLCVPANPARVYRNSETHQIITPRIPPAYFERTEKIRWAYDIWKRTRPERTALNRERKWTRPRFDIHPAIKAIEKMPFLGALAAARQMDFSGNQLLQGQLEAYKVACTSMTGWINRMHAEMQSTPGLTATLRKVGLRDVVRAALISTRDNMRDLDVIMQTFREQLQGGQQNEFDNFLVEARRNSPGNQVDELIARFQPRRNAKLLDLASPQIPATSIETIAGTGTA